MQRAHSRLARSKILIFFGCFNSWILCCWLTANFSWKKKLLIYSFDIQHWLASNFSSQYHYWINHKGPRIKKMTNNQYLRNCIENSVENIHTDVRVLRVDQANRWWECVIFSHQWSSCCNYWDKTDELQAVLLVCNFSSQQLLNFLSFKRGLWLVWFFFQVKLYSLVWFFFQV